MPLAPTPSLCPHPCPVRGLSGGDTGGGRGGAETTDNEENAGAQELRLGGTSAKGSKGPKVALGVVGEPGMGVSLVLVLVPGTELREPSNFLNHRCVLRHL